MANTKLDKLKAALKTAQAEEKKLDKALSKAQNKVDDLATWVHAEEFKQ